MTDLYPNTRIKFVSFLSLNKFHTALKWCKITDLHYKYGIINSNTNSIFSRILFQQHNKGIFSNTTYTYVSPQIQH